MSGATVATEVLMPSLSEGMESGTIVAWLAMPGDAVTKGQELFEVETEKATMTVEAEAAGTLEIIVQVGATVNTGTVIARIGDGSPQPSGSASSSAARELPAATSSPSDDPIATSDSPPVPRPSIEDDGAGVGRVAGDTSAGGGLRASPVAKRVARAHGVDLSRIDGTGPGGRIIRADVERAAGLPASSNGTPAAAPQLTTSNVGPPIASVSRDAPGKGRVEVERLTRTQAVIARRMSEAKTGAPDFIIGVDVDMEETRRSAGRAEDARRRGEAAVVQRLHRQSERARAPGLPAGQRRVRWRSLPAV